LFDPEVAGRVFGGWVGAGLALVAAVLLSAVLASKVEFRFSLKAAVRSGAEARLEVRALFGLVRRTFRLDGARFRDWMEGAGPGIRPGRKGGAAGMPGAALRGFRAARRKGPPDPWLAGIPRRFRFRSFVWHSQLGVRDAAATAVLAGAVWAVKGIVLALIIPRARLLNPPDVRVQPLYGIEHFATEIRADLDARLPAIVLAGARFAARRLLGSAT